MNHIIPVAQAVSMVERMRKCGKVVVSVIPGATFFGHVAPCGLVVVCIRSGKHSSVQVTLWEGP